MKSSLLELDGEENMEAAKQNASIILNHSTAYPFKYRLGSLQCFICLGLFEDPAQFRAHVDAQHSKTDKSNIIAPNKLGTTRVDITDLRCNRCTDYFTTIDDLIIHLNTKHQLGINMNYHHGLVPMKLEKKRFQCLFCSKLFTGIKQLSLHTGTHFFKYNCDTCCKKFETSGGLRVHLQFGHLDEEICRYCKKSFPTAEARKLHVKTTKECQPSKCPVCGERFLYWNQREEHLVTVHKKVKMVFPCTECDKFFHQRTLLYRHFKTTHTNDNKCKFCDKQFPTVPLLQEHIARHHTGERPYACSECHMKFTARQEFKRHIIIHDDSKKTGCPVCNKLYIRPYELKNHRKKLHPNYNNT